MIIPRIATRVGEAVPIRYSFLSRLKSFQSTAQSLTGASIAWTSQSPLIASFDTGSGALVSSEQGIADNIPNDAVIGRFTMLQAGICTVWVEVDATNPIATYVGVVQFEIESVPTP